MSSVDDRIVNMQFNNKQFTQGAADSQKALDGLENKLADVGKSKGMQNLGSAADSVKARFSALQVAGVTAMANIANRAVNTGINMVKSFSGMEAIKAGFAEYELNMNSIQTIMANTAAEGVKLKQVTAALDELNDYADKTIYNFAEMTRNIGTFTAAGVDLDTSVSSIQGIANLAAISGSSSQQASTAMYQLSQAIASGSVKLMDWNSVVNAGMGGQTFQRALWEAGKAMGTFTDSPVDQTFKEWTASGGSFRESLQEGWLTAEVLTTTLGGISGELDAAALKSKGFSDEQAKALVELGKTGLAAATEMKTATQVFDTMGEVAGSGWAKTWQLVVGDFNQAKKLWTDVGNTVVGFIENQAEARNKMMEGWRELGGRKELLESFKNIYEAAMAIIKPISDGFREIFPRTTGERLHEITVAFRSFTEHLKVSAQTSENIKRTFAGVFAVFSIGWQVVKGLIGVLLDLFGAASSGGGGILKFTGSVGDMLVALDQALKNGTLLTNFFDTLSSVLQTPIKLFSSLVNAIVDFFSSIEVSKAERFGTSLDSVQGRLKPLSALVRGVGIALEWLTGVFEAIFEAAGEFGRAIGGLFGSLGDALSNSMSEGDFSPILDLINTGLLGAITLLFKRFVDNGMNFNFFNFFGDGLTEEAGGIIESIKSSFGGLTDTLQAMQANIKAGTLLKIAGAVGILTASVVALSMIDSAKLTKALTGLTVVFGQLLTSMSILTKVTASPGFLKIPAIATAMIALSTAVLILTHAVENLSSLNWTELAKGLTGVAGLMAIVALAIKPLSASGPGMTRASVGLIALGVALNIMAKAVKSFSELEWKELGKGLAGVAGALVAIAAGMTLMPGNILGTSVALIAMGTALELIAGAVESFSELSWADMGKGLVGVAGALVAIAAGMTLMPPNMILTSAGLVLLGYALESLYGTIEKMSGLSWKELGKGVAGLAGALITIAIAMSLMPPNLLLTAAGLVAVGFAISSLADSLKAMGGMTWEEIGKGLAALAGSLVLLAGAMYLMTAGLPGAAALLVMAGALAIIVPIIIQLGEMSWETIVGGLKALAAVFVVLGAAGLLLAPVTPFILALAVAITFLGAGLALAGVGMLAFSTGLAILVASGTAGLAMMSAAINVFLGMLPSIGAAFAAAFVSFVQTIAQASPKLRKAFSQIFRNLIGVVKDSITPIKKLFKTLIDAAIDVVVSSVGRWIEAGFQIIDGFMKSVDKHVPRIVDSAISIVEKFMKRIGSSSDRLAQAGFDMIIDFIEGISRAIDRNSERLHEAGRGLAMSIANGLSGGLLGKGMEIVQNAARRLADAVPGPVRKIFKMNSPSKLFMEIGRGIPEGMARGIASGAAIAVAAAIRMANSLAAAGSAAVANQLKNVNEAQTAADKAAAMADLRGQEAKRAAKDARKAKREADNAKKGTAKRKRLQKKARQEQKQANTLQKKANKLQAEADKLQKAADSSASKVDSIKQWEAADKAGKGDIRADQAATYAAAARAMLAKANAEAAQIKRLQKSKDKADKKAAKDLRKQRDADLKRARDLANAATKAGREAKEYYRQSVMDRLDAIREQQKADAAAEKAQAEYDAADTAGKAEIMAKRAEESQKKSDEANAAAEAALANAAKLAATDADKAMKQLDLAEEQIALAKELADKAKQEREQAEQLKKEASGIGGSGGGVGGDSSIHPSRSVLEDAARAVDRYSASLAQAEEAMASAQAPIQFIQTNTSPKALTASEIYRQTRNLLSVKEIKMGVE